MSKVKWSLVMCPPEAQYVLAQMFIYGNPLTNICNLIHFIELHSLCLEPVLLLFTSTVISC